jgi:hypothetical protein
MCDDAYFKLYGTVNKQNFRYRSAENPHQLHQRPLYDPKVTVSCAVWSREVIGPYFFENEDGQAITVISQHCRETINEFLALKFPPNHNLWFQQDGAGTHTAVKSITAICHLFPQRVISRFGDTPWPPRSPDLTASGFFSVGLFEK